MLRRLELKQIWASVFLLFILSLERDPNIIGEGWDPIKKIEPHHIYVPVPRQVFQLLMS
jgi:hypothetical protein